MNFVLYLLFFQGDGFIGLTIEGEKSELFILDHLKKSLVKVPFSTILEFRPMGEAPDRDGKYCFSLSINTKFYSEEIC